MRACIAMDGRDFLHPLTATFGPIAAIHFLNRNTSSWARIHLEVSTLRDTCDAAAHLEQLQPQPTGMPSDASTHIAKEAVLCSTGMPLLMACSNVQPACPARPSSESILRAALSSSACVHIRSATAAEHLLSRLVVAAEVNQLYNCHAEAIHQGIQLPKPIGAYQTIHALVLLEGNAHSSDCQHVKMLYSACEVGTNAPPQHSLTQPCSTVARWLGHLHRQ
jgi:hypothetical protein